MYYLFCRLSFIYISIISIVAILVHTAFNMGVTIKNNAINKTAIIVNETEPYGTQYINVPNRPSTAEKKVLKEGINGFTCYDNDSRNACWLRQIYSSRKWWI